MTVTDARDLRENTRAMIRLEKAIEALNNTLVGIEKARLAEQTCRLCALVECHIYGDVESEECRCCKVNHDRGTIRS